MLEISHNFCQEMLSCDKFLSVGVDALDTTGRIILPTNVSVVYTSLQINLSVGCCNNDTYDYT